MSSGKTFAEEFPLVNLINGLFFLVSFFVLRLIGFTFIGYYTIWHLRPILMTLPTHFIISIHLNFSATCAMQFYWFEKILRGFYKKLMEAIRGDKTKKLK